MYRGERRHLACATRSRPTQLRPARRGRGRILKGLKGGFIEGRRGERQSEKESERAAEATLFQLQRFLEGRPAGEKRAGTSGYPHERAENISTAIGRGRGEGEGELRKACVFPAYGCGSGNIPLR